MRGTRSHEEDGGQASICAGSAAAGTPTKQFKGNSRSLTPFANDANGFGMTAPLMRATRELVWNEGRRGSRREGGVSYMKNADQETVSLSVQWELPRPGWRHCSWLEQQRRR